MPEIQPMNYSLLTCPAAHTLSDSNLAALSPYLL